MAADQDRWQLLLFPDAASSVAGSVDTLFWTMVVVCGLIVVLVFTLLLVFSVRYRAGARVDRTPSPKLFNNRWLEIGWTLPVLAGFLVFFGWGAALYVDIFDPPARAGEDVRQVNVIGKQWMWKFQHPEGIREINDLHLPVGQTVELRLTSQDVIHSFFVPAFRIKQDVLPQRYTRLRFTPVKTGRFDLFCAEYCGLSHSGMVGKVVVMAPERFQAWLERRDRGESPAREGERLFRQYGCSGCHGAASRVDAPDLAGLYGKPVPLESGETVTADAQYLRDSVMFPSRQVAAGYPDIMPSFKDQISEEDLLKLLAYLQSLDESSRADAPRQQETDAP
ncbi:MAG: cytochrome c oxidase subunit II [Alcanivorax sp.]|uniref:cytochrome c oxidase subunit II n=1 Tax=Alloalcanivorax marinus TaxID=1177169 RepID=UPI001958533A|nr:cytochrome c oxidase subunit II [Alloalcanivorax marinus]MBM7333837.1 cytochrome c oxidase subunit II [Alloalcanivorax marinus]